MEIYAHRGASGTHPENTIAAFQEAARLPIEGVEFDVHLTKDGEVVVIHDEKINRTSNGKGLVQDMTLAELKQYDFGSWFSEEFRGETIPTLQEVLDVFKDTNHKMNIEIKTDVYHYEGIEEKVIAIVKANQLEERVVISSFNHESLQIVHYLQPDLEIAALLMEAIIEPARYLQLLNAEALHLFLPSANRTSIKNMIADGGTVRVFTVNEVDYMKQLQALGVSAIFTDYPEKMLQNQ